VPARMGGVGEVIGAAPHLPPVALLLVNPGVALATPAVFRARESGFSAPAPLPVAWTDAAAMAADLRGLRNDLEAAAISLCPVIADVLAAIAAQPGCLMARMSGSGATCWGLFAGTEAAQAAAMAMPPAWWAQAGPLYEAPA
jgi:4-diphosphocytidyl-2-C-methyl-D-erythritol kinase